MYTLGIIFTVIIFILIVASVVRITYVLRRKRDPTGEKVDLKKIGHEIPITNASRGDPGDLEMIGRIEKKLKDRTK
jgi:hypothetical protein